MRDHLLLHRTAFFPGPFSGPFILEPFLPGAFFSRNLEEQVAEWISLFQRSVCFLLTVPFPRVSVIICTV